MSAVLYQEGAGKRRIISHASAKFTPAHQRYHVNEQDALHWRPQRCRQCAGCRDFARTNRAKPRKGPPHPENDQAAGEVELFGDSDTLSEEAEPAFRRGAGAVVETTPSWGSISGSSPFSPASYLLFPRWRGAWAPR
ncbi:hypothetical protein YQE_00508, partial [Dendroctonus ponderosae]